MRWRSIRTYAEADATRCYIRVRHTPCTTTSSTSSSTGIVREMGTGQQSHAVKTAKAAEAHAQGAHSHAHTSETTETTAEA